MSKIRFAAITIMWAVIVAGWVVLLVADAVTRDYLNLAGSTVFLAALAGMYFFLARSRKS